jgi:hypothetical protein
MPTTQTRSPADRAWKAVLLIPVAFVAALVVGQVLYTLLGYQPEDDDAPLWADLVASVPTLLVFLAPCAAAVSFGRQEKRLVPLVIGALAGLGMTVLTVVTVVAGELR